MHKIEVPILITKVDSHLNIKYPLMSMLVGKRYKNISKTDWNIVGDKSYFPFVDSILNPLLLENFKKFGYTRCELVNYWFQQYETGDTHDWHVHEQCHYSNIYYLDYPSGSPPTEFINPITQEIFTVDICEGDILSVPSFIIHKSGKNENTELKTILVFNTNLFNK